MKNLFSSLLISLLFACSSTTIKSPSLAKAEPECLGSVALPADMQDQFEVIDDQQLLNQALGKPNQGKLCQGQVYRSKLATQVTVYRAWNSTNPNSQFGQWWAFQQPSGEIAKYRADYEICYQWSPLDKLVRCTLKPQTKVVVGNGQSAECSAYLSYPVSSEQQIYIDDAENSLLECNTLNGEFSWK
ncbi:hypothetical protein [Agarivorans sp. Z349TD_8]|uniref:hypothetical protein n=1 Tax=Agarivorans sp. Z349TD_8 TaxID=3421434 RepID=UPI003D7C427C